MVGKLVNMASGKPVNSALVVSLFLCMENVLYEQIIIERSLDLSEVQNALK